MEALMAHFAKSERGISGNFQQKKYPVNPISSMHEHDIEDIFRYIQTHPDMDHMDGIEVLFDEFSPTNFWDTNNTKEMLSSKWDHSPYQESDWKFYKHLRDSNNNDDPRRLTLYSDDRGQYYNIGSDGTGGGDGLHVLAPTKELVSAANEAAEDYNRCSYVVLYLTGGNRIVFGGDSHDETWEHILEHHQDVVTDIDLLIAPHHGRKSDRSYEFLDTLKPKLTFFGNARAEHLAYGAWAYRGFSIVTNNQANCMVVDASTTPMTLYVTHENFARRVNASTYFDNTFKAWYVGLITEDLIP
jgi:competence protein ComEC